MTLPGAEELLNAWEAGLSQPPLQRALILLAAALPETRPEALADLTVGQRDRHLLQLREDLFGWRLQNTAFCPECGERIEWENRTAEFLDVDAGAGSRPGTPGEPHELETGDYALRFRLPNSRDVAAAIGQHAIEDAERMLTSRCVQVASRSGEPCPFDELPAGVIRELGKQLESLDPLADLRIELHCPECGHDWPVSFDIGSFLWQEVDDWARRLLRTVGELAAAFGWGEREILRLSPLRRQLYIGLIGG